MIKLHFPERSLKDGEQWRQTANAEAVRDILVIYFEKNYKSSSQLLLCDPKNIILIVLLFR